MIIKRWRRFRRALAPFVLRGHVGHWWVQRKVRMLENAFRAELVRSSAAEALKPRPLMPKVPRPGLHQILLIGDFMWEVNDLVPELAKICEVIAWDLHPALQERPANIDPSEAVLVNIRQRIQSDAAIKPDVVLFYARPSLLSDEVFEVLRDRYSCPLLGMNLDDKFEFLPYGIFADGNDNYQKWAAYFDLNITNGLIASEWYKKRGLPCIYSAQGVHQPPGLSMPNEGNFKYPVSFLGSWKPERQAVIDQLRSAGVEIALFGKGWPNARWVEDTVQIFRTTQINLGIGLASPSLNLTTTKGRDFECPGVGACYLTTYNWELTQHYELGREILCYRDKDELIEMISFYRSRPEDCLRIAQAAWRRCTAEHTWERRFRRVFREVGFEV
jgi:spore maturation protein CgeB